MQSGIVNVDPGGPGSGVTGGGTPGFSNVQYLYVTWLWPANVANPSGGFDVVFYTLTDATNTDKYLMDPIHCEPNDRHCQQPVALSSNLANVNVAVRSVYA